MTQRDYIGDLTKLRRFISELAWHEGEWCNDVDGIDLQDLLEKHKLIRKVEKLAPCCEACACAEIFGRDEFPVQCYEWTEVMR